MEASPLEFNPANPHQWRERLVHGTMPEAERVAAATREFEALLLRQYLGEALKPLHHTAGGFGAGGQAVYGYLVTDALAAGLSKSGVFGFSTLMQAQLASPAGTTDESNHDNL